MATLWQIEKYLQSMIELLKIVSTCSCMTATICRIDLSHKILYTGSMNYLKVHRKEERC